jgi:hypothetical protein
VNREVDTGGHAHHALTRQFDVELEEVVHVAVCDLGNRLAKALEVVDLPLELELPRVPRVRDPPQVESVIAGECPMARRHHGKTRQHAFEDGVLAKDRRTNPIARGALGRVLLEGLPE